MDLGSVLADVAGAGPFFTVHARPDPAGTSVADVLAGDVLDARIAHVARALSCDDRVAASIAHQGLAALLVSAPLAAVAVHGVLPGWTTETLFWDAGAEGVWAQSADSARVGLRPAPEVEIVGEIVAGRLLDPLTRAVRDRVSVPLPSLRGNGASAIVTALGLVGSRWPHARSRAALLARALVTDRDGAWGPSGFRRKSCCLYYKAPDGGLCGDCVLRSSRARQR